MSSGLQPLDLDSILCGPREEGTTRYEDSSGWDASPSPSTCRHFGWSTLERFSFERRKVIGFAITMPHDWLKKLAPHFHPIRSKTKTNRDSLARVFPRFASATCNYHEF